MNRLLWYILLLIVPATISFFIGTSYYHYSPFYKRITKATAVVQPTKGNTASGVVTFAEEKNGLHITASVSGLTPGKHGFHIHELGDCACDDAACAGAHFNPTNQPHAGPHDEHRHLGDLGNIEADEHGHGTYDYIDQKTTLNGPYSLIGRSVIVHIQRDDLTSQPTGDAGARVGCGTIGIAQKQ